MIWEADLVTPFATMFNQSFRSSLHFVAMFFTTLAPFRGGGGHFPPTCASCAGTSRLVEGQDRLAYMDLIM